MFDNNLIQSKQIKNLLKHIPEYREMIKPFCLLLVGDPGVGKTSVAQELSKVLNADELMIKLTHGRAGMDYLQQIDNFARNQNLEWLFDPSVDKNAPEKPKVVIIDELDVMPAGAVPLRMLLNDHHDKCFFIATCNSVDKINASILSRFERVEIKGDDLRKITQHQQINSLLSE